VTTLQRNRRSPSNGSESLCATRDAGRSRAAHTPPVQKSRWPPLVRYERSGDNQWLQDPNAASSQAGRANTYAEDARCLLIIAAATAYASANLARIAGSLQLAFCARLASMGPGLISGRDALASHRASALS
jgi:hypothetical protein